MDQSLQPGARLGRQTCLVAIVGGTGSGKTTLAGALARHLGARCAVLDHDAYYHDLSHLEPPLRAATNFDHPDALDNDLLLQQLQALRQGRAVDKPRYCFATHTRLPQRERVPAREIVLVEGILLLAPPRLRAAFDLRVFVDVDDDVRALRRLRRDIRERGRTVDSVYTQWLATVRPMHQQFVEPARAHADLIVSGEAPIEDAVRRIAAQLPAASGAAGAATAEAW
ncbi:MAG: uridine kinase [Planctomycetota bacterium]